MIYNSKSFYGKTFVFFLIFSVIMYAGANSISAKTFIGQATYSKNEPVVYPDIDTPILSNVGVAIATSIGTDFYKQQSENSGGTTLGALGSYDEILDIKDMLANPEKVRQTMIQKNMQTIQEYLAFVRNDVKKGIAGAGDKGAYLDEHIKQLEFRYKLATLNTGTLQNQRAYLEGVMLRAEDSIDNIKLKLNTDFKNFDDRATILDVENYLEQQRIRTVARTYLIFCNKFLEQYAYLNNYNKELLDVLILNKKAISTDSYVVIPDSGSSQILRDFDLLYDEEVYKAGQ